MRGDGKYVVAFFGASFLLLLAGTGTAIYLDKFLAPMVRGTGGELLLWPAAAVIVFGGGWAWWIFYGWLLRLMGER